MKLIISFSIIAWAGLLIGCGASIPPAELTNARQAYQNASAGPAAQLVPAELHKAHEALAIAEKSFLDDPKSFRTRDLAYIADRKAKMAEALAVTAAGTATTAKANMDYQAAQTEIVKNTKEDLAASERRGALKAEALAKEQKARLDGENRAGEQLAAEQKGRLDAEKRAADAQADLVKLAAVKEEARGLVITLSGSVLFASNKSALLPAAQNRLNQVADALLATKERKLTVEGHTDSQGSSSYNQQLSQQRADAVRSYIISRGYPSDLIQAQGIGKDRPIADNASAEGRANNRRVEIIVDHATNH
jgi:outer membrane protein OmpA-like peptidoglycan-associated protein